MGLKSLATFDQFKEYNENNVADKDRNLIERLLKSSSDYVRKYTNQDFTLTSYKERIVNWGSNTIYLNNTNINSINSVSLNNNSLSSDKYTFIYNMLTINDYNVYLNANNIMIVDYIAGYSKVPDDIIQAVIHLTSLRYQERKRIGELSKNIGDSTITYDNANFPKWILQSLDDYIFYGYDGIVISREDYNG